MPGRGNGSDAYDSLSLSAILCAGSMVIPILQIKMQRPIKADGHVQAMWLQSLICSQHVVSQTVGPDCPLAQGAVLCGIPGFYPLDASNTPQSWACPLGNKCPCVVYTKLPSLAN